MKSQPVAKDIDNYIAEFPGSVCNQLEILREAIKSAAPKSVEVISYGMPAFKQNNVLVYFAAYKMHIGFYPTGSGISEFENEISKYKYSKGAVQFPINEPLPLALIKKIVRFRAKQDKENAELKVALSKSKRK